MLRQDRTFTRTRFIFEQSDVAWMTACTQIVASVMVMSSEALYCPLAAHVQFLTSLMRVSDLLLAP